MTPHHRPPQAATTARTVRMTARVVLAAALAFAATAGLAANAPPPIKPRPPGMECKAAVAQYGADRLWVGKFSGRRDPDDIRIPTAISIWRCFTTETDCRNWLYWMMSDFSSWQWVNRCDHGYAP